MKVVSLSKQAVMGYIDDGCLSRGASIAFYTVTSLAPVLVIVIAIAGLAFGHEAAQGAIVDQLSGLMGYNGAELLQTMIKGAANRTSGILATVLGLLTLLVTASGVFGEMQTALNAIWGAEPEGSTVTKLVKARAQSLGLVVTLGFLLMVTLVVSAVLTAVGSYLEDRIPGAQFILHIINFFVSLFLVALLFGAIYKVLPDTSLAWRDVTIGALVTAFLFDIGKFLIGLYLGSSSVASSYGSASALILLLLWIYYSSQIFLLGAEFTKAYAHQHGSRVMMIEKNEPNQKITAKSAMSDTSLGLAWGVLAGVFVIMTFSNHLKRV